MSNKDMCVPCDDGILNIRAGAIIMKDDILANGGVFESTVYEPNEKEYLKRFWIEL